MRFHPSHLIRRRPVQWLLERGAEFYDAAICTPARVELQAVKRRAGAEPRLRFSVGIPHYNRGSLIFRPLYNLLSHPAVEEIVIVDDGSEASEFAALERTVAGVDTGGRVKIHRREQNLGALCTKQECVERASSEWVLILDSDNTAFAGFLDRFAAMKSPDPDAFYCAQWAFPFFPFHGLGGTPINFCRAVELCRDGRLRSIYIINDGNYFVHRQRYREVVASIGKLPSDVVDVMIVNYLWLSLGGRLEILPGTSYMHRVDGKGFYSTTESDSRRRLTKIFARFDLGEKWNESFQRALVENDI